MREEITTLQLRVAKGGDFVDKSCELRIQSQFGAFCTKVLRNEARSITRSEKRRNDFERSMEELSEPPAISDMYFSGEHIFFVQGVKVVVSSNPLAAALAQLPADKRDVILMSYFLGMTDNEISKRMKVVRQAISKRRAKILKELREYLTKEGFEWLGD